MLFPGMGEKRLDTCPVTPARSLLMAGSPENKD
jgi:hypothetical protein